MNDKERISELERKLYAEQIKALEADLKTKYHEGRADGIKSQDTGGAVLGTVMAILTFEVVAIMLGFLFFGVKQ